MFAAIRLDTQGCCGKPLARSPVFLRSTSLFNVDRTLIRHIVEKRLAHDGLCLDAVMH